MFYADALAFLGNRGGPITVEEGLKLNLAHLTAVPPWVETMEETIVGIKIQRDDSRTAAIEVGFERALPPS